MNKPNRTSMKTKERRSTQWDSAEPLEEFNDLTLDEDEYSFTDELETVEEERQAEHVVEEDSTKVYLREIGRHKLLNGREEIELARATRSGDELARRKLVQSNLRLVVSIA